MKRVGAYDLLQQEEIPELKATGYIYRHTKTKAKVVVISNEDTNKVFTIGFRTPPNDDTGVPHIMEHSVLCGSKKYPAKDPFVELAKGSLNTFLNAMTYSDKTVYPIASYNDKDFQNLMDVYLDAVFHPNIYRREEIMRQEGWHYELEDKDGELQYNGVVYNEMKGVYSDPGQQLARIIQMSLLPKTTYACESGGDPEKIPELTYEQFLDFHRKYYHPSNSYIYLYGDMNVQEKLDYIDREYLSQYEYQKVDSRIHMAIDYQGPKKETYSYSLSEAEELADKTFLSYNVVMGTSLDPELYMAMQLLQSVLFDVPGAPVKEALIRAGIGMDIESSYDTSIQQPIFSVIAHNANEEELDRFVEIIDQTLTDISERGIDKKALQGAINHMEFQLREADYGRYPKGLMYGLMSFDSWLYDEHSPFIHIKVEETLEFMKRGVENGYFERLIQSYFLNNQHKSYVVFKPEYGLNEKKEEET
ncbi:MAG: insulinase family protein, partial [Lachnospiraceae bacterium]|nr:insulinase family protein [Lachnospiraceae bacterium]